MSCVATQIGKINLPGSATYCHTSRTVRLSRRPHKSIHIAFICRDFNIRDSLKDNLQSYYSYSSVFYDVRIISRLLWFVNRFFQISEKNFFRPPFPLLMFTIAFLYDIISAQKCFLQEKNYEKNGISPPGA